MGLAQVGKGQDGAQHRTIGPGKVQVQQAAHRARSSLLVPAITRRPPRRGQRPAASDAHSPAVIRTARPCGARSGLQPAQPRVPITSITTSNCPEGGPSR